MYLDPTLLIDDIWKDKNGVETKEKAQELLRIEILKDLDKSSKEQGLEDLDMSGPAKAAILLYEHEAEVLRKRNEMKDFVGKLRLFWRRYKGRHKILANVARRFWCIQSTSCEAERIFSKAGYLTLNYKSNLSTSNIRNILFSNSVTEALTALRDEIKTITNASSAA